MTSQIPEEPRPTGTPVFDQTSYETEGAGVPPVAPVQVTTPGAAGATADGPTEGGGKKDAARDEAKNVASDAKGAGQQVAGSAQEAAGKVAGEAKNQTRELYHQTTGQLREQAGHQQKRVASGLRDVGGQLSSMADSSDGDGVATDLVRRAGSQADKVASWLDDRDPGSLLDEVKSFAARKPGTFIAIAAGAGLLAGRLTKSLVAESKSESASQSDASAGNSPTSASTSGTATPGTPVTGAPGSGATVRDPYAAGGSAL